MLFTFLHFNICNINEYKIKDRFGTPGHHNSQGLTEDLLMYRSQGMTTKPRGKAFRPTIRGHTPSELTLGFDCQEEDNRQVILNHGREKNK